MVRTIDYESRRRIILSATINRYIKDASPVASEGLAKDFSLSSATIRNIFSELEEAGYLMHPHTSAGRIPTNKGYRYYVDFLISEYKLLEAEKENITNEYNKNISSGLEDLLEKTSEIMSVITHYTGIVSFLDWQDRIFYRGLSLMLDEPEFRDSTRVVTLIKMFEERERLLDIINRDFKEKVKVYIGSELDCSEINNCALAVSVYRINNRPSGRLAILGPMRMEYEHAISALEYISDRLSETLERI